MKILACAFRGWDRSDLLNLGNSVAVVLYEALRQNGFAKRELEGELHELEWHGNT